MTNVIQQLKDNEKPFCLLSSEMQDFILGCKAEDLEYLSSESGCESPVWRINANSPDEIKRATIDTYRLRPDYADEPEIVEHRIYGAEGHRHYVDGAAQVHSLHQAMDHDDSIGFRAEGWIWGRAYKSKDTGNVCLMIPANLLSEYEVCDMANAHVLFRGTK